MNIPFYRRFFYVLKEGWSSFGHAMRTEEEEEEEEGTAVYDHDVLVKNMKMVCIVVLVCFMVLAP
jgi:hypothetical protein